MVWFPSRLKPQNRCCFVMALKTHLLLASKIFYFIGDVLFIVLSWAQMQLVIVAMWLGHGWGVWICKRSFGVQRLCFWIGFPSVLEGWFIDSWFPSGRLILCCLLFWECIDAGFDLSWCLFCCLKYQFWHDSKSSFVCSCFCSSSLNDDWFLYWRCDLSSQPCRIWYH